MIWLTKTNTSNNNAVKAAMELIPFVPVINAQELVLHSQEPLYA